jgi:hypothetical protein
MGEVAWMANGSGSPLLVNASDKRGSIRCLFGITAGQSSKWRPWLEGL